jgi:hypothetical protein
MRVIVLMDPSTRRTWGTPASLLEGAPDKAWSARARVRRPAGQGLARRLLGRGSSWIGSCEQPPSGTWRRVRASRRDPWEPSARHGTVWSWWCQ